jgi:polyhydroxyalkanoate synthesis regulator phasin
MKLNVYARQNLKAQFIADATHTRAMRAAGSKLIRDARKLRAKAKALPANHAPSNGLISKANKLTEQGIYIRDVGGSRSLSLALAFLNNTPYRKAEAKAKEAPDASTIAAHIRPCLPREVQDKAPDLIKQWIDLGHVKKKTLQAKIDKAKKEAERAARFYSGERRLASAKKAVKDAEAQIVREAQDQDDRTMAILELEEQLQALQAKPTFDPNDFDPLAKGA